MKVLDKIRCWLLKTRNKQSLFKDAEDFSKQHDSDPLIYLKHLRKSEVDEYLKRKQKNG